MSPPDRWDRLIIAAFIVGVVVVALAVLGGILWLDVAR